MVGSMVLCKLCKTPLSYKEQFIGHHIFSHEFRVEDAERAWQLTTSNSIPYPSGGVSSE
jgi:hypothetical protein